MGVVSRSQTLTQKAGESCESLATRDYYGWGYLLQRMPNCRHVWAPMGGCVFAAGTQLFGS